MLYCDTGETRLRREACDAIGARPGMNHERERVRRRGAILELFTFVHDFKDGFEGLKVLHSLWFLSATL